jgi:hypothetical protein
MADGTKKQVKHLVKGDRIATPDGKGAIIRCVIRTATFEGRTDMCELEGGLMITPGHPVKHQGKWVYPKEIAERKTVTIDAFYNLVVDQGHIATVNDIELILLGHNYTEGILSHEYFGSQRVINVLMKDSGFKTGLVNLQQDGNTKARMISKNEIKNISITVEELAA